MTIRKIENPREFFDHVVDVDVAEFKANPTNLRAAYHACITLLSIRDWVVEAHRNTRWTHVGIVQLPFPGTKKLQHQLEAIEPKFAIVTDIANASKHMVLRPDLRRTNLHENADTEVHGFGGPTGRFSGAISGAPISAVPISAGFAHLLVKIDGQFHDVEDCVVSVHFVWQTLFAENSW